MDTQKVLIDKWVAKGYSPQLAASIVADSAEIQPAAAAPAEPAFKLNDLIQIKHFDTSVLERGQTQTPTQTPNVLHWIYARVLEAVGAGGKPTLVVFVDHPGNVFNGEKKIVGPDDYRTAADVQAELAALPQNPSSEIVKDLRRSLTFQADRLQPAKYRSGKQGLAK